jgi:bla regulator protein BlaR1
MIPESLSPLANHLWQSSIFAAAAGLLTLALRKNSARVRHWVWVAASLKFLVPFSVLITLGSHVQWRTVTTTSQTNFSSALNQVSQPFTPPIVSYPFLVAVPPAASPLPAVLLTIWACGFIGISISWWIRWRRIRSAVRAGSPVQLDLPVKTISSPSFLEPGIFGVFRPILLLPEGIFEHLTPEQWKTVVAHELCHVRHRDNLVGVVQMFVETVFWFHPLVWWVGKRIFQERERACDEAVLRMGSEPRTYAQGILKVCELYLESPVACMAGVSGSNLRKRIDGILNNRVVHNLNSGKKVLLTVAAALVVAVPIAMGIIDAPFIQAQSFQIKPAAAATPKWEAVSIRPCESREPARRGGPGPTPGRLTLNCSTVVMLIEQAYEFFGNGRMILASHFPPIEGGPQWIKSDQYTITAKAEGTPRYEVMNGPMLQKILEDRFKLKIHRQTRNIPVYALSVAKGGPKLQPSKDCIPIDLTAPPPAEPPRQLPRLCGMSQMGMPRGSNLTEDFYAVSIAEFLRLLNLDRPVIDKTGITGLFDIHLEFVLDDTTHAVLPANRGDLVYPEDPVGGTSIFSAVQEQLGLKLEATKGPGEFLVVDHVERPSEN